MKTLGFKGLIGVLPVLITRIKGGAGAQHTLSPTLLPCRAHEGWLLFGHLGHPNPPPPLLFLMAKTGFGLKASWPFFLLVALDLLTSKGVRRFLI